MQLKNLVNLVEILLAQVHLVLTQEALQEQSQVQPLVRLTLEAHLTQPLLPLALIVRPAQLLLQLVLIVHPAQLLLQLALIVRPAQLLLQLVLVVHLTQPQVLLALEVRQIHHHLEVTQRIVLIRLILIRQQVIMLL